MLGDTPGVPPVRDLVLLGGGHSHVQVLKAFGMRAEPGVRLTLVTPTFDTPYSGMLPGCIGGVYDTEEIHIKLAPLARFAGARLIYAGASGLDLEQNQVLFNDRPPLRFDVLSINIGAVPIAPYEGAVTVKPISRFLPKWQALKRNITAGQRLVIVGGGAGGVELALAARSVLPAGVHIDLVGHTLMPGHNAGAARRVEAALRAHSIGWTEGRVSTAANQTLQIENGPAMPADHVLWVTNVTAPNWLGSSGLEVDRQGFVSVDRNLRSISHQNVFAVGDIAHLSGQERPKSGVYAVRSGPYLAENLRRVLRDEPLKHYRAQARHLALLGTGDAAAIASRGAWSTRGAMWWKLKDWIDRRFMQKFNELPQMSVAKPRLPHVLATDLPDHDMRCGGCGAKLAADPLRRVLARLPEQPDKRLVQGIGDDAAIVTHGTENVVMTIDGFRAMLDDPYLFGRIAALHSLNDAFAMSATPISALALVTVPLMAEALMEEDIFQVMRGISDVLGEHDVVLAGGHSAEGLELSVGLSVTAQPGSRTLLKGGAGEGNRLILTKPLGTGVVLAAAMQGRASAAALDATYLMMNQSNAAAVPVALAHDATALTDITGFGFAGHLSEMLRGAGQGATVEVGAIPLLPGAEALIRELSSSLQEANEGALNDYVLEGLLPNDARLRLLADPQTSGGLLMTVPEARAAACLQALIDVGYSACDVGSVSDAETWKIVP